MRALWRRSSRLYMMAGIRYGCDSIRAERARICHREHKQVELLYHVPERRLVAESRVQLAMIYDVISMSAARPGFQVRRGVGVADADPGQVGSQRRGVPDNRSLCEI